MNFDRNEPLDEKYTYKLFVIKQSEYGKELIISLCLHKPPSYNSLKEMLYGLSMYCPVESMELSYISFERYMKEYVNETLTKFTLPDKISNMMDRKFLENELSFMWMLIKASG